MWSSTDNRRRERSSTSREVLASDPSERDQAVAQLNQAKQENKLASEREIDGEIEKICRKAEKMIETIRKNEEKEVKKFLSQFGLELAPSQQ